MRLTTHSELEGESVSVSIVIVSTGSHRSLRASLSSVLANDLKGADIIVVDCCSDETMSKLVDSYPAVKFFHTSRKVCMPFLAGTGIGHATGEIVALTDTSCLVGSTWVTDIVRAHASGSLVIGGSVEPCGRMNLLDWSAYFCDYGQFMHPLQKGPVDVLPGNNISIKHSALAKNRELVSPAFWKTLWCDNFRKSGGKLNCEPAIETRFVNSYRIAPFLSRRYRNARCFASMRSKEMTKPKRLLYVVGSPILLVVLLWRGVGAVVSKRRYTRELVLSLPFLVLAFIFWTLGEAYGYLTGTCQGCSQRLTFTSSGRAGSLSAAA